VIVTRVFAASAPHVSTILALSPVVAVAGVVMPGVSVLVAMATVAVLGVRFACHFVPVATRGRAACGMALPIRKYKSSGLAHCV
jgi:hypothetical protein